MTTPPPNKAQDNKTEKSLLVDHTNNEKNTHTHTHTHNEGIAGIYFSQTKNKVS
jgi:hypothetical protein